LRLSRSLLPFFDMQVHFGLSDFQALPHAVVTSGTFDGVHLGHRKILQRLTEVAQQRQGKSVVITFHPHPRAVIASEKPVKLLSTLDEKIELLAQNGIDHLVVIPFTREFSELSSEDFIQQILIQKIGTKTLVIGYDHRFGKNREGGFDFLKENVHKYGFSIEEISRQDIEHLTVSSTRIREALLMGNIPTANHFLGRKYGLSGLIVKGRQLGRTIGVPTANIQVREENKLIPTDGVYAVWVGYKDARFGGMMNVGNRPTVDGTFKTIEVHLLDFDQDIYGENLRIEFVEKVRDEQKFSGLEALKAQIDQDKIKIKSILLLD
jgi:riboflavin kinase / FMN adenylyltransferase